ncbi:MAG: hypothetical protein KDD94_11830, partial [Calditrichaeota bacterium]|nr:hypothetical protein [Calditrichota bacterium]
MKKGIDVIRTSRYSLNAILILFFVVQGLSQTKYLYNGPFSGGWDITTNWIPNGAPGALDTVIIASNAGGLKYVPSSVYLLKITATGSLNISTPFAITDSLVVDGIVTMQDNTITVGGNVNGSGTVILSQSTLTATSQTASFENVSIDFNSSLSSLNIAGAVSSTISIANSNQSTITYNGSFQNIPGLTYNRLRLSGQTKTLSSNITVLTELEILANTTLDASISNHNITLSGNLILNSGSVFNPRNGSIIFTGNGNPTLTSPVEVHLFNLQVNGSTSLTNTAALDIDGNVLLADNSVFNSGSNLIKVAGDW